MQIEKSRCGEDVFILYENGEQIGRTGVGFPWMGFLAGGVPDILKKLYRITKNIPYCSKMNPSDIGLDSNDIEEFKKFLSDWQQSEKEFWDARRIKS